MLSLILGGNGFIGSHLIDALLAKGHQVRVFDRGPERYRKQNEKVDYRIGSFNNADLLAETVREVDVIYHLISTTVPSTSNMDPVADVEGNLIGTLRLLQQMKDSGIKRIVYLSSGGTVYGNSFQSTIEESNSLDPICSYGVVKVAIEKYLYMYHVLYGIEPIILRASNPYGPRQAHNGVQGVIPTFLSKIKNNQPVEIWGDGSVVRDYIYVSDLVELIVKSGESTESGVFNAGSGVGYSLNDVIDAIQDITGFKLRIDYKPKRNFDVQKVVLDISKASRILDWSPEVSIKEGIRHHWTWLNQSDISV